MTLRELDAMCEQRRLTRERDSDWPAARICALIAEVHRNPEKRSEPFTAKDFLTPDDEQTGEPQEARIFEKLKQLTIDLGGEVRIVPSSSIAVA